MAASTLTAKDKVLSNSTSDELIFDEAWKEKVNGNKELFSAVLKCALVPPVCTENEFKFINKKLWKHYNKAESEYLKSSDFADYLKKIKVKVTENPSEVFVHIDNLKRELDANRHYSITKNTDDGVVGNASNSGTDDELVNGTFSTKTEKKILKLERIMKKFEKRIEKLKNLELSLDEMDREDSMYILMEKYITRFSKLWKIYCKLCQRKISTGRPVQKSIKFQGTRYPEVNEHIERFINRKRNSFPDFADISNEVASVNRTHELKLSSAQSRSLAVEVFEDIGKIMKKRRHQDMYQNSMFIPETNETDPAASDLILNLQLEKHSKIAKDNLDKVFIKYSDLQMSRNKANNDEDGDECETDIETDNEKEHSESASSENESSSIKEPNNLPKNPDAPSVNQKRGAISPPIDSKRTKLETNHKWENLEDLVLPREDLGIGLEKSMQREEPEVIFID